MSNDSRVFEWTICLVAILVALAARVVYGIVVGTGGVGGYVVAFALMAIIIWAFVR